ncbi:MAG: hypothetical protein V7752_04580 [Halopseudomonas sp.]
MKPIRMVTLALLLPLSANGVSDEKPMLTHPSQGAMSEVSSSKAQVRRYHDGVAIKLNSTQLLPGNVYTLWFAVMNQPHKCKKAPDFCTSNDVLKETRKTQSDVVYAGGTVADESGNVSFNAFIDSGQPENFWFKTGLTNPRSAELHLIINQHGAANTALLASMLGSYRGGCTDQSLPAAFPDSAKTDGKPGPNTCKMVQVARFQQHE